MSKNRTKKDYINHRIEKQKKAVQDSLYFSGVIEGNENRGEFMNTCLFKSIRKYEPFSLDYSGKNGIPEELRKQLQCALTINRNLQSQYNLSMDMSMLMKFAKSTVESQKTEYDKMNNLIRKVFGISEFENSRLFYPGFPDEVMSKSDAELYLTAGIYYLGTYGLNIDGFAQLMADAGLIQKEAPERTPLTEVYDKPMEYINDAGEQDFFELMNQKIFGNGLSAQDRSDVLSYLATWETQFDKEYGNLSTFPTAFKSKENEALIAAWLHDHGYDNVVFENHMCKDATDILRIISVISQKNGARNGRIERNKNGEKVGNRPEKLLTPKSFEVRLTKEDKRFVKELMNQCKGLYRDMWTKEPYWKNVMRNIDARKGPKRVVQAFDYLSRNIQKDEHGKDIFTQDAKFVQAKESMKQAGDVQPMIDFAKHNPGYFLQRCMNVMSIVPENGKSEIIASITDAAKQVNPAAALKTYNAIEQRHNSNIRIIRNRSGLLTPTDTMPVKLKEVDQNHMKSALAYGIRQGLEDHEPMGKVYIDPQLADIKVPQRQDIKGSDGATVSTGSKIPSDPHKNLVMAGVSWTAPGLDLDLHATLLKGVTSENSEVGPTCGWGSLRPQYEWGVHSGDFTTGDPFGDGKGAQEFVVFDKEIVKDMGYDYVVFDVYGYNINLNADSNIRMVFMEREGSLSNKKDVNVCGSMHERSTFGGEVVEASTFKEAFRINAKCKEAITFAYDVNNGGFIWLDEPVYDNPNIEWNGLEGDNAEKCYALVHALQSPEPSLKQLFEAYAKATNSEIVSDITQADMAFTYKPVDPLEAHLKEDAIVINSMEKEKIFTNFCMKSKESELSMASHGFSVQKPDMAHDFENTEKEVSEKELGSASLER